MAKRRTILDRLDLVFWGMFALAFALGGRDVLAGLPVLGHLLLPEGPASAEARSDVAFGRFDRPLGSVSRYQPQVLQPVQPHAMPDWLAKRQGTEPLQPARTAALPDHVPKIAIVIDDMGGEVEQSRRAISLPKAISLSCLPYPDTAPALARAAYREGHEILVHVPMEPVGNADPGPNALRTDLSAEENVRRLEWDLSRIEGFDGINNHEGSKFTADRAALAPIIGTLAERHLFFLDSRTLPTTQVVPVARAFGVASVGRDVFLDDVDKPEAIDAQLRATEKVAREQGVAIAIGHPRVNTLDALWRWTGEAASRGYQLVPVREAVKLKTEREIKEAATAR
ncbi:MAG: divergent polysaccharide deacetylase family protein [Deltaproteobacteria bacterium]|nr:divergent polysaccharide deacetylase family protein [Deltaproteobacteria bacterium]